MNEYIPPTKQALREALELSEELLRNIELSELPLTNIALKAARLARLLNNFDLQKIFEYEAAGYPTTPDGVSPDVWRLAVAAGRKYQEKDSKTKEYRDMIFLESIAQLEEKLRLADVSMEAARDRDVSIASANPYQMVYAPISNILERQGIRQAVAKASNRLASRRTFIYSYVVQKYHELKFSGIADDIFTRIRERVDAKIGTSVPDAVQRLTAVYENLQSDNPEDWSNAVHSCRRILQDLADAIFPPQEDRSVTVNGKQKVIKLGKDNYINRIIAFVEDRTDSKRFKDIVGSHLGYLGDRLDSIFQAAQKGSHDVIVTREEADRYVVYTYLIIGDILSLIE